MSMIVNVKIFSCTGSDQSSVIAKLRLLSSRDPIVKDRFFPTQDNNSDDLITIKWRFFCSFVIQEMRNDNKTTITMDPVTLDSPPVPLIGDPGNRNLLAAHPPTAAHPLRHFYDYNDKTDKAAYRVTSIDVKTKFQKIIYDSSSELNCTV